MFDAIIDEANYSSVAEPEREFNYIAGDKFDLEAWDRRTAEIMTDEFETVSWRIYFLDVEV